MSRVVINQLQRQRKLFDTAKLRSFQSNYISTTTANESNTVRITFLRHGQSTWNQQNIFIGMTDTPLTDDGILEAKTAGKLIGNEDIKFDAVYTSLLRRSIKTVWMVLQEIGLEWIPVIKDWRLNERSYGALVGLNKKKCVEEYGKDQVKRWRRSWDEPPPPMSKDSPHWPGRDDRYAQLGLLDKIPLSESLKDVTRRTSAFWDEVIIPQLKLKKRILIVGHENNLRSLIKRLDDISETDILQLELPRAIPLIYDLDGTTFKPIKNKKLKNGTVVDTYEGVGVEVELLSGRYICDPAQLKNIAKRDQQQVYDLRYKNTLEIAPYLGNNPISPDRATPISILIPINSNSHHMKNKKDGKEIKEGKVGEEKFKLNE